MGVGTYLGIPKVRRQVITPLTKLEREDLVHSQARKIRRRCSGNYRLSQPKMRRIILVDGSKDVLRS